nr:MAG TPA: hypothetical protein [Caudoviricetes sp.]
MPFFPSISAQISKYAHFSHCFSPSTTHFCLFLFVYAFLILYSSSIYDAIILPLI